MDVSFVQCEISLYLNDPKLTHSSLKIEMMLKSKIWDVNT